MPRAVLGLGSNLGARRALFDCARTLLAAQPGVRVAAVSRLYHTPPLGPPQPGYLNAAMALDWPGTPRSLLTITQHVEALLRRQRGQPWGPRTLDLDILYWSGGGVHEPGLRVPHPELTRRAFALVPLAEVAPQVPRELGVTSEAIDPAFAPAEPFERPFRRLGEHALELGPLEEPLELASAFVTGMSLLLASRDPTRAAPSMVLPFVCSLVRPGRLELEGLVQQLYPR